MSEAIVLNNVTLSKAQQMTLELALSCFIMDMKANVFEDKNLSDAYLKHAIALNKIVELKLSVTT